MALGILDAILLFSLSIPVVMYYRILPVEGTPYWLFGLLFLVLGANCFVSFYPGVLGRWKRHLDRIKLMMLTAVVVVVLGGSTWTSISDRAKVAPVWGVHDIILQQEAAMRYLLTGKNPYKETYFGTPVESWHYGELGKDAVNPALYHFVMPPFYLLFPFPFYFAANRVVGYFDGRMVLLFTMALLLIALWYWFDDKAVARVAITLTALSPSVVPYFVEGRSDVFALAWLMGSVILLKYKQYLWSAAFLALAFMSKHTTWFIAPFYALYVWRLLSGNRKMLMYMGLIIFFIAALLVGPFVYWDAGAFIDSVFLYLTGNSPTSYPVSGYGLGMMLYAWGYITDIHAYYPFVIWQILFAVPTLIFMMKWLMTKPSESKLIVTYAVFLGVYWYMSRYFNNSHLGYLAMLFVLGGLKSLDEGKMTV